MELLLVRHAQTHANVARALDTRHPGADLTPLGLEQAEALAAGLAEQRVDAIWCSPRLRTRRTAAPLAAARGLEPALRDGLVEIAAGDLEMSTDPDDATTYRDVVAGWITDDPDVRLPGGETGTEVLARFDVVVEEAAASGVDHALLVAHGAVIRFWCAHRVPEIGRDLTRSTLGNTGLVRLVGDPVGGWRALEWDSEVVEPATEAGPLADPL